MSKKATEFNNGVIAIDNDTLRAMSTQFAELVGRAPTQVELADMAQGYRDQRERLVVLEGSLTSEELELALESELNSIYGRNRN